MARNRRDLAVASFNLLNLQVPGRPTYPGREPPSEAAFAAKVAWTAGMIRRLDADVVSFQELWSREALEEVFRQDGLRDKWELAFIKPGDWDGIAVAAAVRKPWEIRGVTRHKAFPPGVVLRKRRRSMAEIQADPDEADLSDELPGPDVELLPSHEDDEIEVRVSEFSRSPLQVTIGLPGVSRPAVPDVEVFCAHLKSKLPTRLDESEFQRPEVRAHGVALGAALSSIRRLAEAAALRAILNGVMRGTSKPVVLAGDLNDGQYSNTLAILSGQPSFRLFAASTAGRRSDAGLYEALAMQQLSGLGASYYTHDFRGVREAIDHVLVSEEFYAFSERRLWSFREMRFLNDHLDEPEEPASDHGLVRAAFDWNPA